MSIISFKNLKNVKDKYNETVIVNLGKYIDNFKDLNIPIKIKSFEETLDIKRKFKLENEKVTIEYKPFIRMPKSFKEYYMKEENYKRGETENTYFKICRLDEDESKIEKFKYRERLFNILLHLDMEYKLENGKTMWEDAELKENDYNGLVNLFSGIIIDEKQLDILDIIIDKIKSGITDENVIMAGIIDYNIKKTIDSFENEEEKKEFIENYKKFLDGLKERTQMVESESSEEVNE